MNDTDRQASRLRAACLAFSTFCVLSLLSRTTIAQQNNTAVVQLPTFSFFSVATTVSVPDRGGAYLGGVGQAQSGRNRFGSPLFPAQGALGSTRSASGLHISAEIYDLREMDRALLNQSAGESVVLGEVGRRLAGAQRAAGPGLEHIANLRQQSSAAANAQQDDAASCFEHGKLAEAEGKPGVAKIHYQMAARRATGELKDEVQARLDRLTERLAANPRPAK